MSCACHRALKPGEQASVGGYELRLYSLTQQQGPNFQEQIATFSVRSDGDEIGIMKPSKRNFTARASSTTEAALLTRGFSQIYVSLGEASADGAQSVRIYHKPLVLLIWFGPLLMAFGGLLSLSDRRLRVGAPKSAKSARAMQPAE
jgi:cytochrome c-type biogenesis protein CcmF